MTPDQALQRLGASTAEAIREVLETYAPGQVATGAVETLAAGADPLAQATLPGVVADVGYVDGVTGGNVMVIGSLGARRLAAAMMGTDPTEVTATGELSEMDVSAVGEAMNQMMAAAASATATVLGEEVEIAPPNVRLVDAPEGALDDVDQSGSACTVAFTVFGAQCLLVQFVPHAFVVRMTRAYDEITAEYESAPLSDALRTVPVRVWAELGRTQMATGRVVALPAGAVVELDREVDEPIDLYADGMRFATARLLVDEDGGLRVRVEQLLTPGTPAPAVPAAPAPAELDAPAAEPAATEPEPEPDVPAAEPDPQPSPLSQASPDPEEETA